MAARALHINSTRYANQQFAGHGKILCWILYRRWHLVCGIRPTGVGNTTSATAISNYLDTCKLFYVTTVGYTGTICVRRHVWCRDARGENPGRKDPQALESSSRLTFHFSSRVVIG